MNGSEDAIRLPVGPSVRNLRSPAGPPRATRVGRYCRVDPLDVARRADGHPGFRYEGTCRQAVVYKGRNRDAARYSVIDTEWPARAVAFERWFDPTNFDERGRQRRTLAACGEQHA